MACTLAVASPGWRVIGEDHPLPSNVTASFTRGLLTTFVPTAPQNVVVGHETDARATGLMRLGADHECPSNVIALPLPSTATQKLLVAQDTALTTEALSIATGDDHDPARYSTATSAAG